VEASSMIRQELNDQCEQLVVWNTSLSIVSISLACVLINQITPIDDVQKFVELELESTGFMTHHLADSIP
jgi:hypothetical protein